MNNETGLNTDTTTMDNPINKPTLRTALPDDVITYLNTFYPSRTNGAGVAMKDNVDYITEERKFMTDEEVIACVEHAGLEPLGLLWFLRLKMADSLGWGLDVTDKEYLKLCNNLAVDLSITKNRVVKLSNALIESGVVKVVQGSDGRTYWTTLQQFYNYEYKNWSRIQNNLAAQKRYNKLKNQAMQEQQGMEHEITDNESAIQEAVEHTPATGFLTTTIGSGFDDTNECF